MRLSVLQARAGVAAAFRAGGRERAGRRLRLSHRPAYRSRMSRLRRAVLPLVAASSLAAVFAIPAAERASAQMMGRATGRTGAFLEAQRCALCHSHSPRARALTDANGNDVSPFLTWSATTMANAFRDPYWRAQMSREIEKAPESKDAIESLCLRCHAPATSHQSRLDGTAPMPLEALDAQPLARDGVSCTVCH